MPIFCPTRMMRQLLLGGLILWLAGCGGDGGDRSPSLPGGLEQRPQNLSCIAPSRPPSQVGTDLERVFPELQFPQAVGLLQAPGDGSRWFVLEQLSGKVSMFDNQPGTRTVDVFVDLGDRVYQKGESGLLGMAFHPDYPDTPEVFIYYTRQGAPLTSVISQFTSVDGGRTLDPASEQVMLTLEQPSILHQGGKLGFGPDGYLYIAFGDGGPPGYPDNTESDPFGHGQNTDSLFAALLRIDVDSSEPYAVPVDNPFAGGGGRPEIYAWGLRNPWRWSFDRATGQLWAGDVGAGSWEEVNLIERGGNYGWSLREGSDCYPPGIAACPARGLIDPVYAYSHSDGCAIIGGHVYRGEAITVLRGQYVFGDFCSGQVWSLDHDADGLPLRRSLAKMDALLTDIAESQSGEIYLLDYEGGIYLLKPRQPAPSTDDFPYRLSQTGCVDKDAPAQPAAGLIPYRVNAAFWSDGADKQRWLALPEGRTLHANASGDWVFPVGSVIMKHFTLAGELIETRLLVRHEDGSWAGYSYAWNEAGDDAVYVAGGEIRSVAGGDWIYPSSAQCLRCHTAAAGFTLGLETAQLNGDMQYPSTGLSANQLVTLDRISLFDKSLGQPDRLPILPNPFADSAPLENRARAYLHINCAQCHRPGGPTPRDMDLRYTTPLQNMRVCNTRPQGINLGIDDARLLAPGDPERSLLLARLARRDLHGMPPLASRRIDTEGATLIRKWIERLDGCR